MGKAILFSAPSGCGKTTIIGKLMQYFDCFDFSISATSRKPRGQERDGHDYYFLSREEFMRRVDKGDFLEWEEVYQGTCYGTLKSEISRIWDAGRVIVFDVDVNGGNNIKRYFGADALSIFVMPPSLEVLEQRLRSRGTDSEEAIRERLAKAASELEFAAGKFDRDLVNDKLEDTFAQAEALVDAFLCG